MDEAGVMGDATPLKVTHAAVLVVEQFIYVLRQ